MDSGFHAVDFGFQVLSKELGFLIPIVNRIPDSKDRDSIFHKQNFLGFRNLDSLMWGGDEGRVVRTFMRKR